MAMRLSNKLLKQGHGMERLKLSLKKLYCCNKVLIKGMKTHSPESLRMFCSMTIYSDTLYQRDMAPSHDVVTDIYIFIEF